MERLAPYRSNSSQSQGRQTMHAAAASARVSTPQANGKDAAKEQVRQGPLYRNRSFLRIPLAARPRFSSLRSLRPYLEEPRSVVVHKGAEPLGISIVSGENGGIFVSKVTGGSIAHQAGLEYGDQLLEVAGCDDERHINTAPLPLFDPTMPWLRCPRTLFDVSAFWMPTTTTATTTASGPLAKQLMKIKEEEEE
ncbi:hypothetical protein CRUP_031229 [Coryphaenoides rupestris]|nr:hypothetical protein CRUP_031229 [Coryphaenoides rupestris]